VIEATAEHPLYVSGEGWTAAGLLQVDARLERYESLDTTVHAIAWVKRGARVFTLEVAENDTFLVGLAGVPAHNAKRPSVGTGEFEIIDWTRYPDIPGVPKPVGPVQVIAGDEYKDARAAAAVARSSKKANSSGSPCLATSPTIVGSRSAGTRPDLRSLM